LDDGFPVSKKVKTQKLTPLTKDQRNSKTNCKSHLQEDDSENSKSHHLPSLFAPLSPPASDENSVEFEDLITSQLCELNNEIQCVTSSDPLDLAIQGIKIQPPEWWTDSLTGNEMKHILNASNDTSNLTEHPWSVNKTDIEDAIAALGDVDRFLFQNASGPLP